MSWRTYLRPGDIGLSLAHPDEPALLIWLTAVVLRAGLDSRSPGRRVLDRLRSSGALSPPIHLSALAATARDSAPVLAELYGALARDYGSVAAIEKTASDHGDLMRRIRELPGFDTSRARHFLAGLQLAWPKARSFPGDAERYDHWFTVNESVFRAETETLRGFVSSGASAVEIGGGTGRFAAELGIGTVVEPDRLLGRLARRRGLRVVEAAAEELPFPEASLDVVLMVTVVCFFLLPALAFAEAHRILRPGGRLVVGMVDAESTLGRRLRRRREPGSYYRFANFFSVRRLSRLLNTSGFGVRGYRQTLIDGDPAGTFKVKDGYGEGGFVAIAAERE